MVVLVKEGNSFNIPVQEYVCDSYSDFEQIREDSSIPMGSTALILEEQLRAYKTSSGWNISSLATGGSSSSGDIQIPTYEWARDKEGF